LKVNLEILVIEGKFGDLSCWRQIWFKKWYV